MTQFFLNHNTKITIGLVLLLISSVLYGTKKWYSQENIINNLNKDVSALKEEIRIQLKQLNEKDADIKETASNLNQQNTQSIAVLTKALDGYVILFEQSFKRNDQDHQDIKDMIKDLRPVYGRSNNDKL